MSPPSNQPTQRRSVSSGGERVATAGLRGGLLVVSNSAQEGGWARAVGERAEDAQRVVAMNSDAGGKAVEVHAHALELGEQLFESSLVSHAMSFATPAPRFRDDGAWLTC